MKFLKFVFSRIFLMNLLAATVLIIIISWFMLDYLRGYTLHDEFITVPDMTGYSVAESEKILSEKKLRYAVMDSVYDREAAKGVIISQDPEPESKVKQNRTIYLVVNATQPQKVMMPNLIDLSLRQAIGVLATFGLRTGNLEYVPDVAKNAVIEQKIRGSVINPGALVIKGVAVDLVLGDGLSDEKMVVPSVIGMTKDEAITTLKATFLNVGEQHYDESVTNAPDTLRAHVWKQRPDNLKNELVRLGESVDIWFTVDQLKLPTDTVLEIED